MRLCCSYCCCGVFEADLSLLDENPMHISFTASSGAEYNLQARRHQHVRITRSRSSGRRMNRGRSLEF
jgi:hypothetical protein